jgi:hypothetical protein
MATITVWNKGKRTWAVKDSDGKAVNLEPQASLEMDEAEGRRLVMAYPKDLSTTGVAGPSASDLARREQSLRDREANMAAKEKALEEREAAVKAREDKLAPFKPIEVATNDADKPKRGRPAKTGTEANPEDAKPETGASEAE